MKIEVSCNYCNKIFQKKLGDFNRNNKLGLKIYCSINCTGQAKRKSEFDKKITRINYHKNNYDSSKAKLYTKTIKKEKREYDQIYQAKKKYADYWESVLLYKEIKNNTKNNKI